MGFLKGIRCLITKNTKKEKRTEKQNGFKVEDEMVARADCICSECSTIDIAVMTIADCHGCLDKDELKATYDKAVSGSGINAVFLLGDNMASDIETILDIIPDEIPIFGVEGNHDPKDLLNRYERITNVNKRYLNADINRNYSIAGLSGSIRYKDSDYYSMLTNKESIEIMDELPYADILITHDRPCFEKPDRVTVHSGLLGIGKYIVEEQPKIVLHGHLHKRYIRQCRDTVIKCCYGVEVFRIAF